MQATAAAAAAAAAIVKLKHGSAGGACSDS
jgi:hypothetical protein